MKKNFVLDGYAFKFLIAFTTVFLFINTIRAQTAYMGSSYTYQFTITTNNTLLGMSADQTNFVALLKVKAADFTTQGTLNPGCTYNSVANGTTTIPDFAIADVNAPTAELYYEIDHIDASGNCYFWVRIPTLYHNKSNNFYIYYGGAGTHTAAWHQLTWTSITSTPTNYSAVIHFNEDPSSSATAVLDATNNGNNVYNYYSEPDSKNTASKIGNGVYLSGGWIGRKNATNLPATNGNQTLSLWVQYPSAIDYSASTGFYNEEPIFVALENSSSINCSSCNGGAGLYTGNANLCGSPGGDKIKIAQWGGYPYMVTTGIPVAGTWHLFVFMYNKTTNTSSIYVDGALSASSTTLTPNAGTSDMLSFGGYFDNYAPGSSTKLANPTPHDNTVAYIDEAHILPATLSADWIKAEYINQNNPDAFTSTTYASAYNLPGNTVYKWTGAVSTDVTVAGNWTNSTVGSPPNQTTPIANSSWDIPVVTNYPKLTANTSLNALTIETGAKLDLNGYILSVGCNIYNNGTLSWDNLNASGITFNGSIANQSYNGAAASTGNIGILNISSSYATTPTITVNGSLNIYNTITLSANNKLAVNNSATPAGVLTLKSVATGTYPSVTEQSASIGPLPSGASITGNVNVERVLYADASISNWANGTVADQFRSYRLLSKPVNDGSGYITLDYINQTVGANPGALTAGPGGVSNGFTSDNKNSTIYFYQESLPVPTYVTTFTSSKYVAVTKINSDGSVNLLSQVGATNNKHIPSGNGFMIYFVGNTNNPAQKATYPPLAPPETTTITAIGQVNQGTIPLTLFYGPSTLSYTTTVAKTGYNLVGNPYPCPINLQQVYNDNSSSIVSTCYELPFNQPQNGFLAWQPGGGSSPAASQYIDSGEGFWVQTKGTGLTFNFKEDQKATNAYTVSTPLLMGLPKNSVKNIPGFYLKIGQPKSSVIQYTGIYFDGQSDEYDMTEDASDINATSSEPVSMASFSKDGMRTMINRLTDYSLSRFKSIRLFVSAQSTGMYRVSIEQIKNIDTLYDIYLVDKHKNDSLDMRRYRSYAFNIDKTDTSTFGAYRFELHIERRQLPPYQLISFTAQKTERGIQLTWKTQNEYNFTGFRLQKLQNGTYNPINSQQSNGGSVYSFIDVSPVTGTNTYRLEQDDVDDNISYSNPVSIDYSVANPNSVVSVYPNPAQNSIQVAVNSTTVNLTTSYQQNIYNSLGAVVMSSSVANMSNWTNNISHLLPGNYILEIKDNKGSFIGKTKFTKLK